MKKYIFLLCFIINICLYAKETNSIPPPFSAKKTKTYAWSIGIGGIYTFNAYKGTKDTRLIIPMISYTGKHITLAGPYFGYHFLQKKKYQLTAQAFLYPLNFKPNKSSDPKIKKLNKRKYTIMAGIRGDIPLQHKGEIQLGASKSIYGANGYFLNGQYKYTINRLFTNNLLLITPGFGLEWHSNNLNNYYYGISSAEIASGILPYTANSSFNPFVSLNLLYFFKQRWSVGASMQIAYLPNTIYDSPMVDKRYITTSVLFLTRSF